MLDTAYRDFGYGYLPRWHDDIIDPAAYYLEPEDHCLLVAETEKGEIVGTAGVRKATPASPPHPREAVDRFEEGRTATLYRVYVRPEWRRRGMAGALVRECLEFVATRDVYTGVYLHTDARVPGAVPFWERYGELVCDERDPNLSAEEFQTAHFALAIPR